MAESMWCTCKEPKALVGSSVVVPGMKDGISVQASFPQCQCGRPIAKIEDKIDDFKFDTNTVLYLIYLLHISNIVTRNNIREMLDNVKKPLPSQGVIKFLMEKSTEDKIGRW